MMFDGVCVGMGGGHIVRRVQLLNKSKSTTMASADASPSIVQSKDNLKEDESVSATDGASLKKTQRN